MIWGWPTCGDMWSRGVSAVVDELWLGERCDMAMESLMSQVRPVSDWQDLQVLLPLSRPVVDDRCESLGVDDVN